MDCIDCNNLPTSPAAPLSTTKANKSSHKTALLKTIAKLYLWRPTYSIVKFLFGIVAGLLTLKIKNKEIKQSAVVLRVLHFIMVTSIVSAALLTGCLTQVLSNNVLFYSLSLPFIVLDLKFLFGELKTFVLFFVEETKFFQEEKELFKKELNLNRQNDSNALGGSTPHSR